MSDAAQEAVQTVLRYHQRSKHHFQGYARSLGYLDWANQPDPFRRYEGAPRIPLDFTPRGDEPRFDELFVPGRIPPQPLNRTTISQLFSDSLALSAWKQAPGSPPWSLRVNPSSGDLHPTEAYLLAGPLADLNEQPSCYHYSPFEHVLEQRRILPAADWARLVGQLPPDSVLVGLASIYWREAWKYGERAFRYCHHDVGHAIGALAYAAAVLGWKLQLLETVSDSDLAALFGTHRQCGPEAEHPDCLLVLYPQSATDAGHFADFRLPGDLLERLTNDDPMGIANRLSDNHHDWPVIEEVGQATRHDDLSADPGDGGIAPGENRVPFQDRPQPARQIIFQRRSAVAMDGHTAIDAAVFYHILARLTPGLSPFPFASLPWRPRVSLILFVHRVEGVTPGVYVLLRDAAHEAALRDALKNEFVWQKPDGCPESLDLFLLQAADAREAAKIISCQQDIAADGVFSLGMLAEFEPAIQERGAWFYPRLFWETGLIGQVLYLEAEAAGIRGTGIGCFFDDALHGVLGIEDMSWQTLYHFTLGGAVDDPRLQTLEPYFHRRSAE